VYELRNRTGITIRNRIRNRTNNELRNRIRGIIRNTIKNRLRGNIRITTRNATIDSTPQNNIFREYIFIEVKLLPPTPPTLKPIPIPPSRPNDLKHIAIDC
jgi:hypothetical protein